ncbi:MAG: hypothetical protein EGS78_01930, partial [Bacteroidales bacterium]|nr:hypothetical protein [Bacteroidales bacterium]
LKNMSNLLERPERLRNRIFTKLFDVAELAQLDDKDRTNYIKSMNTERDTYNQIEYAREEGAKQKSCDIAKRMLEKGIDIETISELTGLTEKEISKLNRIGS